ncbi:hypothetical protein M0812_06868 [Anaeramoeba flamelloides]|uniref:Uncharacterized protein n=1 Tax=Anaeramoeba flamelloides TaxID=1746091 RepID=A0AAV8A8R9_9EUKA|nr:hypothetical protein M0812_06868 [Anaeramoeba flamelloides]
MSSSQSSFDQKPTITSDTAQSESLQFQLSSSDNWVPPDLSSQPEIDWHTHQASTTESYLASTSLQKSTTHLNNEMKYRHISISILFGMVGMDLGSIILMVSNLAFFSNYFFYIQWIMIFPIILLLIASITLLSKRKKTEFLLFVTIFLLQISLLIVWNTNVWENASDEMGTTELKYYSILMGIFFLIMRIDDL